MNEGTYLELVNDLRDQYNEMKTKYQKRIAFLEQNMKYLKQDLNLISPLQYNHNQFSSPRDSAPCGSYTCVLSIDWRYLNRTA